MPFLLVENDRGTVHCEWSANRIKDKHQHLRRAHSLCECAQSTAFDLNELWNAMSVAVLLAMCRHDEVAYDFRTSLIQIRTNTSTKSISDPKHSIVFATPQKKPFELHNNFGLMHLNAFTIGSHINQNVQRGKQCE